MRFIDRKTEMQTLEREYAREGSSLVILYGRRRIGKSTLISEFIKGKKALFFLASEENETQNRIAFQQKAAEFTQNMLLANSRIADWDTIFRAISDTDFEEKPILVIDEFQYLGKANPAFPSVFQRIWDEQLMQRNVMVILCGSLISMMSSQTLSYSSPLYGRRTAQIRLQQIPFRYYGAFFPQKNRKEQIEYYAVTGGVPKYIELFSGTGDIYQAISECILNRTSFLYEEPQFLLQQEVSEIGTYFSIIRAIAAGNTKLSAIAAVLEIKATGLSKYLSVLIDLDILERETPVTEENPEKSKKGLYKIRDNYLRFWFLFVYPNRSYIESDNSDLLLDKIKREFAERQAAFVYEDICRNRIWALSAEGKWNFMLEKVGRWWNQHEEIDIVALGEGKNIIFGECKYRNQPVDTDVFYHLKEKTSAVMWNNQTRTEWYILFSLNGFTQEMQKLASERGDIILISETA